MQSAADMPTNNYRMALDDMIIHWLCRRCARFSFNRVLEWKMVYTGVGLLNRRLRKLSRLLNMTTWVDP